MTLRTQRPPRSAATAHRAGGRPILLVTLGVPIDPDAAVFAVDAAVESGQRLIVANITRLAMVPLSVAMGYDALEEFTPEVTTSLVALVRLARSLGVAVERLRVRTPRQVSAMRELIAEVVPGVVVFGPERGRLSRRLTRRLVEALRRDVDCLVWLPA
jgi:hypothetical protein